MACDGRYADAEDYAGIWGDEYSEKTEPFILKALDMSAPQIHAALASRDSCDCTLQAWAEAYLKQINCVLAALFVKASGCPFPTLTPEEHAFYGEWTENRLGEIRDGTVAVCQGDTGTNYPAIASIEQSVTPFAAARIVFNRIKREDG